MKIVAISDTHNQHSKLEIPYGDVLVHAGDATGRGSVAEVEEFNKWLGTLPHPVKIFVPGNHDWLFEKDPALARSLMTNAIVLIDEEIIIDGLKFYGSPHQPEFCNWAFNVPRGAALAEKWKLIPKYTDVLITHGPPHSIRDEVVETYYVEPGSGRLTGRRGMRVLHVGCEELLKVVQDLKPSLHIFGHIHYSYGQEEKKWDNGKYTVFINASICTEAYAPVNKPIVVEV